MISYPLLTRMYVHAEQLDLWPEAAISASFTRLTSSYLPDTASRHASCWAHLDRVLTQCSCACRALDDHVDAAKATKLVGVPRPAQTIRQPQHHWAESPHVWHQCAECH